MGDLRSDMEVLSDMATTAKTEPLADETPPSRFDMNRRQFTRCQADDDGYCEWTGCPQLRDDEPKRSGRHCPWDKPPDEHTEAV